MYHSINPTPHQTADTLTPAAFEHQVRFILQHYAVVRLTDLASGTIDRCENRRRVAFTFDDGFRDFREFAYPILQKYSAPCAMFVPTAFIGHFDVMSQDDIRELHRGGLVDFGSHTLDHRSMRQLSIQEMVKQACESKEALEALLGAPVRLFAYPFGQLEDYSELSGQVLEAAGYELAVTASWGTVRSGDDALTLKRVFLGDRDDEETLSAKIEGEYDWMGVKASVGFFLHSLGDRLLSLRGTPARLPRWGPRRDTPARLPRWGPRRDTPARLPRWGPRRGARRPSATKQSPEIASLRSQ